jgi:hypothetical protein
VTRRDADVAAAAARGGEEASGGIGEEALSSPVNGTKSRDMTPDPLWYFSIRPFFLSSPSVHKYKGPLLFFLPNFD